MALAMAAVCHGRPADAAPEVLPTWTAELGLSRASSSSPLFRFSPEGTLVLLPGRSRLAGTLLDGSLSGQREWVLGSDWRPSVSVRVDNSVSRQARDLQFGQLSVDGSVRRSMALGTAGIGVTLQRLWVAGQSFRDVPGFHLDATRALGIGSHVMLGYDRARYRHSGEFVDLDALVQQVSGGGRVANPLPGVSGLDVQAGWRREDNRRGLQDLSLLGRYLRLSADHDRGPWSFNVALTVNRSHYRASLDEVLPARREQSLSVEIGASVDLSDGQTLKMQAQWSRNRARPALFDNRYRSFGVGLASAW